MEKEKYTPYIYFSDGSIFVAIGVFLVSARQVVNSTAPLKCGD